VRIAFLGTPDVAVPSLRAFVAADDIEVVAVLTNPDRPRGRSKQPVAPPVKQAALEAGLDVWQPERPRHVLDAFRALDVDACAVVAYGALLPADVLAAGGRGFVNLHFSLLPRWRGAAPVQHAIRAGDATTGITTFVLDEGMDTGPILATLEEPIRTDDTAGTVLDRLAETGAPVLVDSVRALVAGATPTPQPTEGATLAPKISSADVALDLHTSAIELDRLVRSASPAPGAHTTFRGKRLKVGRVLPLPLEHDLVPGAVLERRADGVVVACGTGAIQLLEVQPEGKARMDGAAFANGYDPEVGELLGSELA
jgi:methionyl-tRNA formyltransferase